MLPLVDTGGRAGQHGHLPGPTVATKQGLCLARAAKKGFGLPQGHGCVEGLPVQKELLGKVPDDSAAAAEEECPPAWVAL